MAQNRLRIPVDTSQLTILATGKARKARKADDGGLKAVESAGESVWQVYASVVIGDDPEPQTWRIDVVGDPGDLPFGVQVRCHGLEARPWEMVIGRRVTSGMSFRAERVEVVQPAVTGNGRHVAGRSA